MLYFIIKSILTYYLHGLYKNTYNTQHNVIHKYLDINTQKNIQSNLLFVIIDHKSVHYTIHFKTTLFT